MKRARALLTKDMRADDAFRTILGDCLTGVRTHAQTLRTRRDAEALHQIRVALRRLEVVLGAFGEAFRQSWFAQLRGRAKVVLRALGPARDLDVLLDTLWPDDARARNVIALRRKAEAARDRAWKTVRRLIRSEDFVLLLDDLAGLEQSRLPLGGDMQVGPLSRRLLDQAAARVRKRGHKAQGRKEETLHRLRIALKKLRYLTQAFASLYPGRRLKPYLQSVRQLQEELGHLNDLAQVHATMARLAGDAGDRPLPGRAAKMRLRAVRLALARYDSLRRRKPYWKRA